MNKYNLPRGYLSYSAATMWERDKIAFRKKYYEDGPSFETKETVYGKKFAKLMEETGDGHREYPIEVTLDNIPLKAYLDVFYKDDLSFVELKTGHSDKYGNEPWDAVKVRKHKQLVWYSLLIKLKHGKVKNKCRLIWHETILRGKSIAFMGHNLESESSEVVPTGRVETFTRTIFEWERKKLIKEIKRTAQEIHEDYTAYQASHVAPSQALAPEVAAK